MANEFLISKWKIWYDALDVNHDGTISIEDVEESRSKFTEMHHLEADKKKMVSDNFEKWWNTYIFRGKTGEISVTEFVDTLKKDYEANKGEFEKQMDKCFTTIFDVIDTNHDRDISEEEFIIAFSAYGHDNVAEDKNFFKEYKPKDGVVPIRAIVESWIDFVCSSDASKTSIVKSAFERMNQQKAK